MKERTARLLNMSDETLFRAGGCHVFALTLRELRGYPLLWIHKGDFHDHDHIACMPANDWVLDFFGWASRSEYVSAAELAGSSVCFEPIDEEELRRRFNEGTGSGYYSAPDFYFPAVARASDWLAKHQEVFDGTRRIAIPGVSRVERCSDAEVAAIFSDCP